MKLNIFGKFIVTLLIFSSCSVTREESTPGIKSNTNFVNPFIGTATVGHTYPAATLPFAMVQVGPDTGDRGWDWCSGYHSQDSSIKGFSHIHLSGTGAADMGDILFMPVIGEPVFDPGKKENPDTGYRSRFSHDSEIAKPGYYSVKLDDYNIFAEFTSSPRVGFHRYTFPESKNAGMLIDLDHGMEDVTVEGSMTFVDDQTITGYRNSSGFIKDQHIYFCARFSKPFEKFTSFVDGEIGNKKELSGKVCKGFVHFGTSGDEIICVKVALSTVSEEGALKNLEKEIPDWDFDNTKEEADRIWNECLSKIDVETINDDQKTIFYTALYHCLVSPNLVTDVDGAYRGWDGNVHEGNSLQDFYTNFSLWDTYRAIHPLYALLYPDKNIDFIKSMLQKYKQTGQLPINEYGSNETYCMIGYHAVPVISEAILKDHKGFSYELAYEAMKSIAMDDSRGIGYMKEMEYIPSELESNSVSKVLEYAYNDWCISRVAKKLWKMDDHAYFSNRAKFFKNQYDITTGFMRGRHADGSWVTPFNPKSVSILNQGDFTEGNSWQYSFYVPQDVNTLIELMGGDEKFCTKLDTLFNTEPSLDNERAWDVTGLIGQYAHGNEPSHHIAYLYNYAGKPWKTQEVVNEIKMTQYSSSRDGLCGNDDCGQMSAWYIFGSLGFYPVTPGMDYYVIGSPSVKSAKLHLPNGKEFIVKAANVSESNYYIQSVLLNGQNYTKSFLNYNDIQKGSILEFNMGNTPQKEWAIKSNERPFSKNTD
uniref:GH92 family glycosyl hydrolase n=1 Tax=uncultured Draconibacterium sp. TaxID=1573823 RepID=UPI003217A871